MLVYELCVILLKNAVYHTVHRLRLPIYMYDMYYVGRFLRRRRGNFMHNRSYMFYACELLCVYFVAVPAAAWFFNTVCNVGLMKINCACVIGMTVTCGIFMHIWFFFITQIQMQSRAHASTIHTHTLTKRSIFQQFHLDRYCTHILSNDNIFGWFYLLSKLPNCTFIFLFCAEYVKKFRFRFFLIFFFANACVHVCLQKLCIAPVNITSSPPIFLG